MPKPTCPDCRVQMESYEAFHTLIGLDPQGVVPLYLQKEAVFGTPIAVYQCPNCGLVRLYSAEFLYPDRFPEQEE